MVVVLSLAGVWTGGVLDGEMPFVVWIVGVLVMDGRAMTEQTWWTKNPVGPWPVSRVGTTEDLLYAGLEADCDVAMVMSPSVLLWRLTGWRCVTRRAFVSAYMAACFAKGLQGMYLVDDVFVDDWHDGYMKFEGRKNISEPSRAEQPDGRDA